MRKIHSEIVSSNIIPICNDNISNLLLQNQISDQKGHGISLMIKKCDGDGCASGDEINRYINRLFVGVRGVVDILQFTQRVDKPVFQQLTTLYNRQLSQDKLNMISLSLRQNTIETQDGLLQSSWPSYSGTFYDIGSMQNQDQPEYVGLPGVVFSLNFFVDTLMISHSREVYNLMDLIGDLGGVLEVITFMFGIFLVPISEFSFVIKALQKLYLARTTQTGLFKNDKMRKKKNKTKFKTIKTLTPSKFKDTPLETEVNMHYPIKLRLCTSLKLYIMSTLGCLFCKCAKNKKDTQLLKLYEAGQERLANDLSVEKMIKSLRDMKILLKSKFLDE